MVLFFFLRWEIESPSALKQRRMCEGAHDSQCSQALRQKGAHTGWCIWWCQPSPQFCSEEPGNTHVSHQSAAVGSQSPKKQAEVSPPITSQALQHRLLTAGWQQPGEGMDSTTHLQTILLQPLHSLRLLSGDPAYLLGSRGSRIEQGPHKKGPGCVASLVRGWAQEEYSEFCNSIRGWIANPLQTAGCHEVSTGVIISMIITNT